MTPESQYVQRLVEERRFTEALYFGALMLARQRSPELHLLLGLACHAAIRPLADLQRMLRSYQPSDDPAASTLMIGANTLLVYEGFYHLIEALRQDRKIQIPESTRHVADEILLDLQWYMKQESHGFASNKRDSLKMTAVAGAVLLHRLTGHAGAPSFLLKTEVECADQMIEEELNGTGGDAVFYRSV